MEFRFALGDPGLFVEMFLREEDFERFASEDNTEVLGDVVPSATGSGQLPSDDETDQWNWTMHDATHHRLN